MSDKSHKPIPLDYRTAQSPKSWWTKSIDVAVRPVFGGLLGLLSVPFLIFGLAGFVSTIRSWSNASTVDREADLFQATLSTLIGLICLVFCLRWTLGAERARRRQEFTFANEHRKTGPLPHYPTKWDEDETETSESKRKDAAPGDDTAID